jgi:arylsulfatase A-like enzyme
MRVGSITIFTAAAITAAALGFGVAGCAPSPEPAPPEIVIVIGIDTLRADHLGLYGAARPTSPFLDSLAREGAVFERAYATSPWTLPTFASIFTGRLQSGHAAGVIPRNSDREWESEQIGPLQRTVLDPAAETLAGRLADAGWKGLAVVQNPYLNPAFGIDRGFEFYDYLAGDWQDSRRADEVIDRSLQWIDEQGGERFMLFVHLFDPHMPYDPPAPWAGTFTDAISGGGSLPVAGLPQDIHDNAAELSEARREFIAAAYDEEIRFVDSQLERFVASLRQRGIWDRALVVLTSDHGEELFDHGGFEHGHTLYEELLRVPLIIWGPGIEGSRTQEPVSVADITPTVLDAAGLSSPEGIFGRSLLPHLLDGSPIGERVLVAEGTLYGAERKAAILWPHKLIRNERNGRTWLFDLEADPGEQHPLTGSPEIRDALAAALDLQLRASADGVSYEQMEIDPELREQLRALGYIR